MKHATVIALVVLLLIPIMAMAQPDPRGQILVSTRNKSIYAVPPTESVSPGDMGALILLQNAGYRGKLYADAYMPDEYTAAEVTGDTIELVYLSGSSSSSDVQAVPEGVPVLMGEHVTLANPARAGTIPFYAEGTSTGDTNRWGQDSTGLTQYMKLVNTSHPITQGIQTDANGLVRILRDPYPNEDAYSRPDPLVSGSWKKNYEYAWPGADIAGKASGLTVLGVSPLDETRVVFAVLEQGATMANGQPASARYVHIHVNENGSGGTMRRFLGMNETGRLLFLRAAQWAMGDPLSQPGASEVENWNLY
ncbi:MAG: hypothetical protein H3C63_11640 [Candidatus Omnitrophica bacterium]|nr:hypothetical protein [Candidatus Omnitrophota bacterium]